MMPNGATRSRLPDWVRIALIGRRPKRTLIRVCVLAVVCYIVLGFLLLPVRVDGLSMLPTYRDGGRNLINRLPYLFHEPRRGDVVGVRFAGPHLMLLKRIVGLPGETVEFADGHLLVDGKALAEPYVKSACHWNMLPRKLGARQYFVVGDNRSMGMEFHEFGVAARERILGKILL